MTATATVTRMDPTSMQVPAYSVTLQKIQSFRATLLLVVAVLMLVAIPPAESFAAEHYDFSYSDRGSLLAAGWNFLAVTSTGAARNTEQTTGAVASYDQAAHPGVLRIPADTGDIWADLNNTRNSLFRNLPLNWTSIRLKLSFNPTLNYQQAGLLVYQDDDNYVQVTRMYEKGNNVTFANEYSAIAGIVNAVPESTTTGLHLRLDRDQQDTITGYYSRDGIAWVSLGSVTQSLGNPKLAIVIGASPGGYPNADLAWAEVEFSDTVPPAVPVTVATWKDNHRGALSVSTDDGDASCFDKLQAYGFAGTYVMNGTEAPSFYTGYFNAGMELGSHLANHVCYSVSDTALREENIEPSIAGICSTTPQLCKDVVSMVWPCGYTNAREEGVASDYFLSARGYDINQLENPTPSDFFNLKSFNSHEHTPYPPDDLKTVVTMAEQQGKWANLAFHTVCNDDGAIAYAASRDIWIAPIGTVVKYILQRNRMLFKDYVQDPDTITFSFARTALKASPIRSFETAINSEDTISLLVNVDSSRHIATVRVNGAATPYQVKTISGNAFVLINTAVGTSYRPVEIRYQGSSTPPAITLSPMNVSFNAVQGSNPANQTVALSNGGGGTMTWTATASTSAPAWLSVSPASGTGDRNLTLSVASTGLAPGTYTKTITVAAAGASNTPQIVNVTLTVILPQPAISLAPSKLSFTANSGINPPNQTIALSNGGTGTMSWTAAADNAPPAWLSVTPASGTGAATLTVSVTSAALTPGTYTKNIMIAAPGATNTPQTIPVTLTVLPVDTMHYDFTYSDRATLLAGGWNFLATTSSGAARNTEQLTGTIVSYDQSAHPGIMRIPADTGDLWAGLNNTRNSLFRTLPANWNSIRLKLSFAPTQNYQQAGLVAYQDDNTYVQVCRIFENGNRMTLSREAAGAATNVSSATEAATANLFLRLDRELATDKITGFYSLNGTTWVSLGSVTQTLATPKLAIVVGASPGGFPNADIAWAEVITAPVPPVLAVSPKTLSFTSVAGANPPDQNVAVTNSGGGTMSWTAAADGALPAWLSAVPASGTGAGNLTVSATTAGLAPGTYTRNITVAAAGAGNNPQTIAVTLNVISAQPVIVIAPSTPSFTATTGTNPESQTLAISNGGSGTMSWTAAADGALPAWLSVTPGSGTGAGNLTISANAAGLAPGTYTNNLTIAATEAANSPQTVVVTLHIIPEQPTIVIAPSTLSFTATTGTNPADQTLAITNGGTGTMSWTATVDSTLPAWLSLSPASGAGSANLTVSVTAAGLAPGTYTRNITIVATGASNTPLTVPVTLTVQPSGTEHHDFTYPDRSALLADGWDFLATTAAGAVRNTEQLTGKVVSYDQAGHPGVLRIPADTGDLWAGLNNTRNSLFRTLPANWTGIRLKLSFAPTQNYQQAGLLAYQDDNNYIQICRIFESSNRMTMTRETSGAAANVTSVPEVATANLFLRLDRDPATEKITAQYSLDGTAWISLGSVTQPLTNPKLAIVVGASPAGFPNADIAWAEVLTTPVPPAIAVSPKALTFTSVAGANPPAQKLTIANGGGGSMSWTAAADNTLPAWLSAAPESGTGDTDLTVTVAGAGLDPGTYTRNITIAATGASNTPQVVPVTLTVLPSGTEHRDFTYPDRPSLLAAGWNFLATSPSGTPRNTEQVTGTIVSYDQTAHPGILQIPADVGDLWAGLNNTRNTLFRDLPSNWASIRLKLSFSPTQNYQQAGLLAYQNDNNYVQICRIYENGNRITLARESNGAATNVGSVVETSGTNLHLRLDRNPATDLITAFYSLNGTAWVSMGSVTQALTNPKLAIVVGASPGGLPNADLAWTEVLF